MTGPSLIETCRGLYPFYKTAGGMTVRKAGRLLRECRQVLVRGAVDPIGYFVSDRRRVVYVVNSKAAGRSIKHSLMAADGHTLDRAFCRDIHSAGKASGYQRRSLQGATRD